MSNLKHLRKYTTKLKFSHEHVMSMSHSRYTKIDDFVCLFFYGPDVTDRVDRRERRISTPLKYNKNYIVLEVGSHHLYMPFLRRLSGVWLVSFVVRHCHCIGGKWRSVVRAMQRVIGVRCTLYSVCALIHILTRHNTLACQHRLPVRKSSQNERAIKCDLSAP